MTAGNAKLSKASKRERLTCRPHNVELKRTPQPVIDNTSVGEQLLLCQTKGAEFEVGELLLVLSFQWDGSYTRMKERGSRGWQLVDSLLNTPSNISQVENERNINREWEIYKQRMR